MKKQLYKFATILAIAGGIAFAGPTNCQAQAASQVYEYHLVTTIESVVPGGLGRSRMISTDSKGKMEEVTMENFFSLVGINFGNVRGNDQLITGKINQMSADGFELSNITSGVYSTESSTGIFITRYFFRRPKK